MARDESDFRTRVCGNCRAKVAADRPRCPRCGAVEASADPEIDAARSKRLAMISGTLLALALIAVGVIHFQQPAETATVVPKSVADPLAALSLPGFGASVATPSCPVIFCADPVPASAFAGSPELVVPCFAGAGLALAVVAAGSGGGAFMNASSS